MDKKELILKVMADANKPLKSGEIVELSQIPKKEVSKLIDSLKKEGKIGSPKRCYYVPREQ